MPHHVNTCIKMASILVTLLMLVLGLALAAGGFLFFKEAFYLLGALAGLSVGIAAFGNEAVPGEWELAVLVVAPVVGLVLAVALRVLFVALVGVLIGGAVGIVVAGVSLSPITNLVNPIVATGIVLGVIGAFFAETVIFMFASASWGARLVTVAFGAPLVPADAPPGTNLLALFSFLYWAVFLLGLIAQVGVWYYLRTYLDDDESLRGIVFNRAGRRYESLRS